jgi:hypothetical protein
MGHSNLPLESVRQHAEGILTSFAVLLAIRAGHSELSIGAAPCLASVALYHCLLGLGHSELPLKSVRRCAEGL